MSIQTIGVIGCGLMGSGIVEVSAKSGFNVIVGELNEDLLTRGLSLINKSFAKAHERGKISGEEAEAAVAGASPAAPTPPILPPPTS